jgi:hypothetical protein
VSIIIISYCVLSIITDLGLSAVPEFLVDEHDQAIIKTNIGIMKFFMAITFL